MGSALWAGISGLNSSSKEMDVIANNIANVNTVGYKAGKTYFADVLSQSISGGSSGSMQVGRGVQVTNVGTQFTPGSFETTGNATDVAIDGDGFFIVNDGETSYYTRAGAFHLDSDSYLVDTSGYRVQGYTANALGDICLADVASDPSATTVFSIGANLDAETVAGDTYTTTQTVYDTQNGTHNLSVEFKKTEAANMWGFQVALDGTDATDQSWDGLKFDSAGVLSAIYTGSVGGVTPGGTTTPTATATVDNGAFDGTGGAGTFLLTKTGAGFTAADWALTTHTGAPYGSASILTASTSVITIDFDGIGGSDMHLDLVGDWPAGNTASFTLTAATPPVPSAVAVGGYTAPTATAALNQPGQVYQTETLQLTKTGTGTTAADWSISDAGLYTNATILSANATTITLDLDGAGGADVTLTLAGDWALNNTAGFTLTHTETTPVDLDITFAALAPGADPPTIGADADNVVSWDLAGTTALELTQYVGTSVIKSLSSDGYQQGDLKSLSVDSNGWLSGFFTNGQTEDVAQLAVAKVPNVLGLQKMGANLFRTTRSSGEAAPGLAGVAGLGSIASNSLEMSNTDIATEFIKMITAQKAYSASARVITTQDQMMSELMNIKR